MNCPTCNTPLFGAANCSCGFHANTGEATGVDISYWEGLAAFWRMYWAVLLFATVLTIAIGRLSVVGVASARPTGIQGSAQYILQFVLMGLAVFLFIPRIITHPFRTFILVTVAADDRAQPLTFRGQFQIWCFLYARMLGASVIAGFLLAPLNIFLSLFRISAPAPIAFLGTIFATGPILLKMLVGHEFSGFRVEVRRRPAD